MSALATYSRSAAPLASLRPTSSTFAAPRAGAITPAAARYRDTELMSATPGQLVVLLYEKLLLTLRRGRVACEAGRIEERCELLMRAHDMVEELCLSLDRTQGGAIAEQLGALYVFMQRELVAANRTQDPARIDVVLRMAGELRDAFATVVAQSVVAQGAAPSAAARTLAVRSA